MGSHSNDQDYPTKKQAHQQHMNHNNKYKLKVLLLVIITNLLTVYIFTSPSLLTSNNKTNHYLPPLWDDDTSSTTTTLLLELNSTKHQLSSSHSHIAHLLRQLASTNSLVRSLLVELSSNQVPEPAKLPSLFATNAAGLSSELKLAVGPHKLPLGFSPRMGSDEIYQPIGAGCFQYQDDLNQYMTYNIGGECPVDDVLAQKLILRGCEPLPRRRCHPKSPSNYVHPKPVPGSLWTTPPDTSIIWDPYTCKSYKCLIDRKNSPGFFDCKDCFDLQGREKSRWLFDNKGGLDYGIDQVLSTKPPGTIRIGFDIGGGTGTFAARMRERNVTILTSSMNLDGPFNSFIASRGLIPIHFSVSQRLPFFENTLDIVHSMHVLSNWIPDTMLEFTLFDIYRVLRPGGLFWLDRFFCLGSQFNETYVPMLGRIGFKKLRWNAGMKLDRGIDKNEWYFSALLEKPILS